MTELLSERLRYPAGNAQNQSLSDEQRRCMDEFRRRVQNQEYRFRKEACPCGSKSASPKISEVDRYGLPLDFVICLECGTVRIDPYLDEPSLADFYSNLYQSMYGRATEFDDYFRRQGSKTERIVSAYVHELHPTSSILDVGCGAGGGIRLFQQRGFQTAGCDYDRELIDYGRTRGVPNLVQGSIAEVRREHPKWSFDLIYLHHVFEHVIDPVALMKELKSVLKPHGRILIIVPDISQIGSSPWPGGDVLPFFHVAHKYNYSREGLRKIAEIAGLQMRALPGAENYAISRCPELWMEFSPAFPEQVERSTGPNSSGEEMLQYLRKTEESFRLGRCPAQIALAQTRMSKSIPISPSPVPTISAEEPSVAILLATYNGQDNLEDQIESIRAQRFANWTLLVSDDRSDDATLKLLQRMAEADCRIQLLPQPAERLGPTANFGRLLDYSRRMGASYVAFSDQDDVWFSEKLATQLNRMRALESTSPASHPLLVHTDAEIVDAARNPVAPSRHAFIGSKGKQQNHRNELSHLLMHSYVQGCTVLMNRPLLDIVFPLPAEAAYHDWWCALCAAATGAIDFVAEPTVQYRQHGRNCVGARRHGILPIARRLIDERRSWQNGMSTFVRSIDQAFALWQRLRQRGLSQSRQGEVVELYCRIMRNERSRFRRVWKLHRGGIPATDRLRKLVSYARVLMLPTSVQRGFSTVNGATPAAAHAEPAAPEKTASDPGSAAPATLQAR